MRKRQQSIDAVLRTSHARRVTVEFLLNGRLITVREWPTRAEAIEAATERRHELERAGWSTHW